MRVIRDSLREPVGRELISDLYLLLLEGQIPALPEWAGWPTLSQANGLLPELGFPKVAQPDGYP